MTPIVATSSISVMPRQRALRWQGIFMFRLRQGVSDTLG